MRLPLLLPSLLLAAPLAAQQAATEAAAPTPRPDPARLAPAAQFARYDADNDGVLRRDEVAAWASELRNAKEPDFDAEKPEAKAWIQGVFEAIDTDRNAQVDLREFTAFVATKQG